MLKKLTMINFRKHADKVILFEGGMTAVRGANEAGKSTIYEAILYALFGSPALRDSLAETVTWGRKESELKVELTVEVNRRLFSFVRSKAGAEALSDQGIVTGQKEVSNFAAEVLGADMNTVTRLMMANQNSLRGALEEGPKAVAVMIESLSDFDLFDRILEAAQVKWIQGSPSVFEARVKEADQELAVAPPTPPSTEDITQEIASIQPQVDALDVKINELTTQQGAAQAKLQGAEDVIRMRASLDNNLRKAKEQQALHVEQKKVADKKAAVVINEAEIAQVKKDLLDADAAQRRVDVYGLLTKLIYPEAFWEGSKETFDTEVERLESGIQAHIGNMQDEQKLAGESANRILMLKGQIITSTVCPSCGQDLKDKSKIEERNLALQQQIADVEAVKTATESRWRGFQKIVELLKSDLSELKSVAKSSAPFEKFATQFGEFLEVDFGVYPPKLNWKGELPNDNIIDKEGLRSRLVSLESAKEERERADARSVALAQTIEEDAEHVERLQGQLALCPEPTNVEELKAIARSLGNDVSYLKSDKYLLEKRRDELKDSMQKAQQEYEAAVVRRRTMQEKLESAQRDLDLLNFNNTLLKKIRAARPIIGDKLWASVLGAVSVMFTQMRGEQSVVTKGKNGFAVNGMPVTSLSGSTLDLLGTAIRVALTRTFLPHTSFMILDEPQAAADESRSAAMLGFLKSLNLDQVIVVSHDEAIDSVADHLITI